jgi:hypothetical protein
LVRGEVRLKGLVGGTPTRATGTVAVPGERQILRQDEQEEQDGMPIA